MMQLSTGLSIEQRLIHVSLYCIPDPGIEQELLQQPFSWNTLFQTARAHAVISPVCMLLSRHPRIVPDAVIRQWRQNEKKQRIHARVLAAEMGRLLKRSSDASIDVIAFKGPALAVQLYGSIDARQFADIDFLCRRTDAASLSRLLEGEGYTLRRYKFRSGLPEAGYHYTFDHAQRGISVELHWDVTPRMLYFPLRFNQIRDRAVEVMIPGSVVRTPCPEHTLLILCVHGTKHAWSRQRWIADIAAFVATYPDLDWSAILDLAQSCHCRRMVLTALCLARDHLGARLPQAVTNAVNSDPSISEPLQALGRCLFQSEPEYEISAQVFQLLVRDGLIDRYRYIRDRRPFTQGDARLERGHFRSAPELYYLLLANDLLHRVLVRPFQQLWGRHGK